MSRFEPRAKHEKVSAAEDERYDDDKNDEDYHDEFGGDEEDGDANSLLAPSLREPDYVRFGNRGATALWHSCSHRRNGNNCWLWFGVLATVAVTVSWVWSSGDGASNLVLRLRQAASAFQLEGMTNPDEELIATPRPYLHELIADFNCNITGNVSWLMDFAIIGHPKCSTTSLLYWLRSHPEILMHEHEVHALSRGQPAEMVSLMYALPNRPNRRRGYKAPTDIMTPRALDSLRTYWPDVKLIVGVRHPVKWFESYYNFVTRQEDLGFRTLPRLGPAETMDVPSRAYFHAHLSLLGKTNVTDPGEMALLGDQGSLEQPFRMNNKVFLYESTQPYDLPKGRNAQYRRDLQAFLGLKEPLDPIPLHGETDGDTYNYSTPTFHYVIDICEDKYARLRRQLVDVGTAAADWILTYFVPHPDVTVSSPERFEQLLRSWSHDPCETSRKK